MKPSPVFSLVLFCFAIVTAAPATGAAQNGTTPDNPSVKSSGLTCFTITPSPYDPKAPATCNDLCGARGAVCTGVTSAMNPPQSCESPAQWETCRCCAVK